jgi:hypothetical protein
MGSCRLQCFYMDFHFANYLIIVTHDLKLLLDITKGDSFMWNQHMESFNDEKILTI